MKMKKYIKLALPIFIGLLASCSAEEDLQATDGSDSPENGKKMTFTANIDTDVTRTHFDTDQKTVWSSEDKIWICNPATTNANNKLQFTLTSGGNSKTGTFEAEKNIATSTNNRIPDCFYAVYPCNDDVTIARKDNSTVTVSATIPAEQTAEETLSTRYQYLTAYTTGSSLSFKNVVSYFKVTVKSSDDFKISRIKIVANNIVKTTTSYTGEYYNYLKIAGKFTSTIGNSGADAGRVTIKNADITGDKDSSYVATTIVPSNDAHTYYLAVLPNADGSSLNFTLLLESDFSTTTYGQKIYQATKQGLEFKPGKVYDLGTFDAANLSSKVLDNVVDLDLPSGTIWCNKDLGSDAVGTPGPYFQWGQIPNANGIVEDMEGRNSNYTKLENLKSKYTTSGDDNVGELGAEDDAVNLANSRFAMPTFNQARELTRENVNTWPIVDPTFTNCCRVQNKAKNRYIILSKQGRVLNGAVGYTARASYWSKTRRKGYATAFWYDFALNGSTYNGRVAGEGDPTDERYYGRLLRGVVINKNIAPVKTYSQLKGGQ